MVVRLATTCDPVVRDWNHLWFAVTGTSVPRHLSAAKALPDLARRLDTAFLSERETWWQLGRKMAAEPSAWVAHAPAGAALGSDFGLMLAWSRLVADLAEKTGGAFRDVSEDALVLCDDPWLYRHLARLPGVHSGAAPALIGPIAKGAIRGIAARLKLTLYALYAALSLRGQRSTFAPGDAVLLAYGHPESRPDGHDAYFTDLMIRFPTVKRLLHVDCPPSLARTLGSAGRTASLHGFGNALYALSRLPFIRWIPGIEECNGSYGWLIRRSAAKENSGAGPAMRLWQIHCQKRWLEIARPSRVVWPWENFAWERALCRDARTAGVRTYGYQHTVIGPYQINYSPAGNHDGLASIPDAVISDGPAYRAEMIAWGVPEDRILMGGSLRIGHTARPRYDPNGLVSVPLSGLIPIAVRQLDAARRVAAAGYRVQVKDHPMYPLAFEETDFLKRTTVPLCNQSGLRAVLYCTGTSGLEAVLGGVPALRLLLEDRICVDVLPETVKARHVTLDTVIEALENPCAPPQIPWDSILSPPDFAVWRSVLIKPLLSQRLDTPAKTDMVPPTVGRDRHSVL